MYVMYIVSARSGNLEVLVYLKARQGYTIRKMDIVYIDKCWYEIQEKKKFWYGIPAYTDPFQALYHHTLHFEGNPSVS
jgi:hypothetical protein